MSRQSPSNGTESGMPDHADLFRRERRRRPLVWWLSMAFLGLAAALVLVFLWQAGLLSPQKKRLPPVEVTVLDEGTILVRNTHMAGLDEERLPFELKARISARSERDPDRVRLEDVEGTLQRRNGEKVHFTARRALYDLRREQAWLEGDVHIWTPDRFDIYTDRARVDVRTKTFHSEVPVRMVLADGEIRAGSMRTGRHGDRVFFGNRVYATFGSEARKE